MNVFNSIKPDGTNILAVDPERHNITLSKEAYIRLENSLFSNVSNLSCDFFTPGPSLKIGWNRHSSDPVSLGFKDMKHSISKQFYLVMALRLHKFISNETYEALTVKFTEGFSASLNDFSSKVTPAFNNQHPNFLESLDAIAKKNGSSEDFKCVVDALSNTQCFMNFLNTPDHLNIMINRERIPLLAAVKSLEIFSKQQDPETILQGSMASSSWVTQCTKSEKSKNNGPCPAA